LMINVVSVKISSTFLGKLSIVISMSIVPGLSHSTLSTRFWCLALVRTLSQLAWRFRYLLFV
jgi:hypothetical protein